MSFIDVIILFLLQFVSTCLIIVLFGTAVAFCNKIFYRNMGGASMIVCYATGFIGTPIHELSHALMCLIFRHKITEIKLFQIGSQDGTLGYVNHSYNKKNVYHRIGNYFIGIAPLIVGLVLMMLVFYLLMPDSFNYILFTISDSSESTSIDSFLSSIVDIISHFELLLSSWQLWVFVAIGLFVGLHMTLSKADIKGAADGLIFYLIVLFFVDTIIYFINSNIINSGINLVLTLGIFEVMFFIICLFLFLAMVLISFVVRYYINRLKRGKI